MAALHWFLLAALLGCTLAEEQAIFYNCEEASEAVCSVKEVRINPCNPNKKCIFKKGVNASISFDFEPNFASSKLVTTLYGPFDVEFDEMTNVDACQYTKCPTEPGKSQVLDYTLYIGKKLPQGTYTFKWKLWNPEETSQLCCFKTTIKIRK
ncbi:MD-2-related lipid-recognition protein [Manduca sexta]|nr:MD-2-related lipid-recognition protein [Manduca sexta]KAG6456257.1 hypothetical protein O3G_MSEX009635 [Manduca sexta]KAG6456258.1 hypothetical protein O3G_MSEX009635 [Manduca sexta]